MLRSLLAALVALLMLPAASVADSFTSTGNALPSGSWRPYSASSPFNRLVPANPKLAADSSSLVSRIRAFSPQIDNMVAGLPASQDYAHPTYYSSPSDPLVRVHCTESWGRCGIEGMSVRIPKAARPTASSDAHMTVVADDGWEYDFWQTSQSRGSTLNIGWGGRTPIGGTGLGSDATAARFGNLAGVIRAPEAQRMGDVGHALFMVVACDDGSYVYPAMKSGHRCSGGIPMGSHLWLAMSDSEIGGLAVPGWQKMILRALAHYGAFMGDTGGPGWQFQFESGLTYTSFGRPDPLVAWAKSQGWAAWNGTYVGKWNLPAWVLARFRVLDPCVARGAC